MSFGASPLGMMVSFLPEGRKGWEEGSKSALLMETSSTEPVSKLESCSQGSWRGGNRQKVCGPLCSASVGMLGRNDGAGG